MIDVGQILYLAVVTGHSIPKLFTPYLSMSDLIRGIQQYGLDGYLALQESTDVKAQVERMYSSGLSYYDNKKPTVEELKALVSSMVFDKVSSSNLSIPDKTKIIYSIHQYLQSGSLIEESTFNPFDVVIDENEDYIELCDVFKPVLGKQPRGGLYILAADTKVGKSRTCIKIALDLLISGQIDRLVYVSLELTKTQVTRIFQNARVNLSEQNKKNIITITGKPSPTMLRTELENMGWLNNRTMVIYDSPDIYVQAGNVDATSQYNVAINELKQLTQNLAMLLITSQVTRSTIGIPTIHNLSLSSTKAQYADAVMGMARDPSSGIMTCACLANRNGDIGGKVSYMIDYGTLLCTEQRQIDYSDAF